MSLRLILIACACTLAPSLALAEQPVATPAPDEAKPPPEEEQRPTPEPAPEPETTKPDGAPISAGGMTTSFDQSEVRSLAGSESIGMDSRSYAKDWLVAPRGYNIGGELRFITASTSPDGPRIKFTDLAILRLQTRWTASRRIELSGSVDLLAKQPDSRKDIFIQGGGLGIKIATSRANAIAAGVSGGPTMGDDGFWGSVGTGVIHRSRIEQFLAFQYGGGASATGLRISDGATQWQAGLAASSELVFHTPRGEWATWLGFDLELPVVHSDALDPRSRLGVTVGMVFAAVKDWDIYTVFTWRDRGTTDLPATTLPIIDGGFDQKQFAVGLTRRFSVRGKSAKWALAL